MTMMLLTALFSSLLLVLSTIDSALAEIGPDGNCTIYALAPFANHNREFPIIGLSGDKRTNVGFSQVAAALLAAKHFNSRNATVVSKLSKLSPDCTVMLDIPLALNAIQFDYTALRYMAANGPPSCAIVGPFDDLTGMDMKTVAQAHYVPLITTMTSDIAIVSDNFGQFSSSVSPDLMTSAVRVVEYLLFKNRTNYVAFVYNLDSVNMQRRETISVEFTRNNIEFLTSTFSDDPFAPPSQTVFQAMKRVKESGFRTIVIAESNPWETSQLIADAAEALGMNNGGYFYVWFDVFEPAIFLGGNKNITKLVTGSVWIMPPSRQLVNDQDPFLLSWMDQGPDFVEQVKALNPFSEGEVGYVDAPSDFFQTVFPEYGSAFMYDAVMAAGIGACNAQQPKGGGASISSVEHQMAIRNVSFWGATWLVEFGNFKFSRGGARAESSTYWAAVNMVGQEPFFEIADVFDPEEGAIWIQVNDTIYADGTTSPPNLLRDEPEQNHLSDPLRIIGFVLMGTTILMAIIFVVWVFWNRNQTVVKASQPEFLYLICFGTMLQTSAILPSSFDESHGWDISQLDKACMAAPWLLSLGHIIVYSALFTKLWRVNKVLQFSRRKIKIQHVAWPMAMLMLSALVLLVLWTVLDPLRWARETVNDVTGESIGGCQPDGNIFGFVVPLTVIMLIPTVLTAVMAYKTKDVDESFSESWWIFVLIVVQIEVVLIAVPVVFILNDESTDGKHLGLIFLFWSFPMTTLALIFFPKVVAHRRALKGHSSSQHKRGQRGNSRVSGVQVSAGSHEPSTSRIGVRSSVLSTTEEEKEKTHSMHGTPEAAREENFETRQPPKNAAPSSTAPSAEDGQSTILASKGETASEVESGAWNGNDLDDAVIDQDEPYQQGIANTGI